MTVSRKASPRSFLPSRYTVQIFVPYKLVYIYIILKNGFPPLNIPSIDPFYHGRSHFEYKQGILTITQNLKNVIVYGISQADIKEVRSKANDKNIYLEFDVIFPRLEMLADYKGNAILSELNVKSGGKINITAGNVLSFEAFLNQYLIFINNYS